MFIDDAAMQILFVMFCVDEKLVVYSWLWCFPFFNLTNLYTRNRRKFAYNSNRFICLKYPLFSHLSQNELVSKSAVSKIGCLKMGCLKVICLKMVVSKRMSQFGRLKMNITRPSSEPEPLTWKTSTTALNHNLCVDRSFSPPSLLLSGSQTN